MSRSLRLQPFLLRHPFRMHFPEDRQKTFYDVTHLNRISHFALSQSVRCRIEYSPTHRQLKVSALSRSIKSLSVATLDAAIRAKAWRCNLTDGIALSHRTSSMKSVKVFVLRCFYLRNSYGGSPCTDSCLSQPVDDIPESSRQQSALFVERTRWSWFHFEATVERVPLTISIWLSNPSAKSIKMLNEIKMLPIEPNRTNAIKRQIFSGKFRSHTNSID